MTEDDIGKSFVSLPDYLATGLRLVLIGINPGTYSAQRGHYFARGTNRFWPAFSRSRLSASIRQALGREALAPDDDVSLLSFGIGFSDVVKTASRNASELHPADFLRWAPVLLDKLRRYEPKVACFHGVTAYRSFLQYALDVSMKRATLGEQSLQVGTIRLFVVPSPSGANAHFDLRQQIEWYDRLEAFLP